MVLKTVPKYNEAQEDPVFSENISSQVGLLLAVIQLTVTVIHKEFDINTFDSNLNNPYFYSFCSAYVPILTLDMFFKLTR